MEKRGVIEAGLTPQEQSGLEEDGCQREGCCKQGQEAQAEQLEEHLTKRASEAAKEHLK